MSKIAGLGILGAGGLVLLGLALVRSAPGREEAPHPPKVQPSPAGPPAPSDLRDCARPGGAPPEAFFPFLPQPSAPDPGAPVIAGSFRVRGPGGTPDGSADLGLTDSQRAVVEALLADRDRELNEIRTEIGGRTLGSAEADRLSQRAERAQQAFRTAVQNTLLPEQQRRFDELLASGRWGGYTLVIPTSR